MSQNSYTCVFLITYSFCSDHIAHFCRDRKQAEKIRDYYIGEEEKIVREEQEYQPYIDRTDPENWIFWYKEEGNNFIGHPEYAEYRIICEGNYTPYAEEQLRQRGII